MSRDNRPETLPLDEAGAGDSERRDGPERQSPETVSLATTQPLGQEAAEKLPPRRSRLLTWFLGVGSALLVSALVAMAAGFFLERALSLGLWYHWLGVAGLVLVVAALLGFVLREAVGLARLKRLGELQARARAALDSGATAGDAAAGDEVVAALEQLYSARPELEWALAGFRERRRAQLDPADQLDLFETHVLRPLDKDATHAIAAAARRTTAATAISPFAWLDMVASFTINLALLGRIARIYGGRPGRIAGLRLLRLSFTNVLAAGAIDLADDTFGDLLGASFAARLSTRAGTGVLNGLLTARLGLAAADLCRPLPWRMTQRPAPRALMKRALLHLGRRH